MTRAISITLAALCGAGLLLAWMPDDFAWRIFQMLVFALLALWTVAWTAGKTTASWSAALLPFAGILGWGAIQLHYGWTAYRYATSVDLLRWLTYAAVFFLAIQSFRGSGRRTEFRSAATIYALILAIVSVFQHFLGNGKIYWLFTPAEAANMGPFLNRDHYASFIALMLPMAVVDMLRKPRHSWFYGLTAAVLYASSIAGASRAGFVLLTLELIVLAMLVALPGRAVLGVAGLIVALGFVVGWDTLYERLQERDPYGGRREVAAATVQMIRAEPWKGYGLGSWTRVYPEFAERDFGVFINAAHNDWLQWTADGGAPMLACMMAIFLIAASLVQRCPWALGVPIVFLHCLIDFPMQGRYLPAILFLILGMALAAKQTRKVSA